jgi:hypothetical protein
MRNKKKAIQYLQGDLRRSFLNKNSSFVEKAVHEDRQ